MLFTASTDRTIRVWNLDDHTCIGVIKGHSNVVQALTLSPDENLLVSGSSDTNVKLWDPVKRTCLKTLSGHDSSVTSCTFSHDGRAFVSSGSNGEILCWDHAASKVMTRITAHPDVGANICVFSPIVRPNNYLLATGGNDNLFKLWNL
ncbi:WD40 repeat domain-containing protein, partial [Salmonella sp. s51228]|uniref:WD40 repeat domain-containing protein n=1 Tax=Salmonella sp. s51228 TaxID=3159652 RepID=UPI00397F1E6B